MSTIKSSEEHLRDEIIQLILTNPGELLNLPEFVGTTGLSPELRKKVAGHLDAVRLIGEDIEIRPPRFVPLTILVILCIYPGYWPEDIRTLLEQEFSDSYTPDGRRGFFHPDVWMFGQPLYKSRILGCIHTITGVHPLGRPVRLFNTYQYDHTIWPLGVSGVDEMPGPMHPARLTSKAKYGRPEHYIAHRGNGRPGHYRHRCGRGPGGGAGRV